MLATAPAAVVAKAASNTPHMPNETLIEILKHLNGDKASLGQCNLVSKGFYDISTPHLWKNLKLTPWSDSYIQRIEERPWGKQEITERLLEPKNRKTGSIGSTRMGTDDKLQALCDHTRTLDIEYHDPEWCLSNHKNAHPFQLRNLETLHLRFHREVFPSQIHDSGYTRQRCRLLSRLQPTTIILNQFSLRHIQLENLPRNLWEKVENIIFIVSPYINQMASSGIVNTQSPIKFPIRNLKSITVIYDPSPSRNPRDWDIDQIIRFDAFTIAALCETFNNDIKVNIINPGLVDKVRSQTSHLPTKKLHKQAVKAIKKQLENCWANEGWNEYQISQNQEKVNIMTFGKWVELENEWRGKIDEAEVKKWRKIMCNLK